MSSITRNSSRKKFNITPEDLVSCLDQKNSMIAVLQAQVQDLRFNQEKYQRLQQDVYRKKEKFENLLRDYEMSKLSNHDRLDLTLKNCLELKVQVDHFQKQIQLKTQKLKDFKAQSQQLIEQNSRRQDDITEVHIKEQELLASNQLLKMQSDRSLAQICMAKQELERQRRENSNINKSLDTVKDKCYKTQSYIRNLLREESTLNENLAKTQDQNNYLDNKINELNSIQSLKTGQCSIAQKQIQQGKFYISSKELELKRVQKQLKQTVKNLNGQKQKTKIMNEHTDQKKFSLNRMQNQVSECSEQINYILSKNTQVLDVNQQLKQDLKVCAKHLQNVIRVNKYVENDINKFKQTSLIVMKKLQQPTKECFVYGLLSGIDINRVNDMNKSNGGKWNSKLSGTGFGIQNTN